MNNPNFTELIERHRNAALTELEACNSERKQLAQRRADLGTRFVSVEARLRLLKEMEADLNKEPTNPPATVKTRLVPDEAISGGWKKESPRIPLASGATVPLHCQGVVSSALVSATRALAMHSPVQQALANAQQILASQPSVAGAALRNAALILGAQPSIFGSPMDGQYHAR